jgi:hypothetical protein
MIRNGFHPGTVDAASVMGGELWKNSGISSSDRLGGKNTVGLFHNAGLASQGSEQFAALRAGGWTPSPA